MKMKKRKISCILSAIIIFSLSASMLVNAEDGNIVVSSDGKSCYVEQEFDAETDDTSKYNPSFKEEVTVKNNKFKLDHIDYEVSSLYDGTYDEIEEEVTVIATNTDATPSDASKTITRNGLIYDFKDTKTTSVEGESVYLYEYKYYTLQQSVPDYPKSVTTEYTKPDGTVVEVELPFESITETNKGWAEGFMFDGVIENYDADYWEVEGEIIPKQSDGLSLTDTIYANLVKNAGYDPADFKNYSATYTDDNTYTNENGVVCRDFVATCEAFGTSYEVKYGDMIDGLKDKYRHTSTYILSKASKEKIEEAKNQYLVKATAVYTLEEQTAKKSKIAKVVIPIAVVIGLILIASFVVYIVKGGRKDTDYRSKRDSRDDYKNL